METETVQTSRPARRRNSSPVLPDLLSSVNVDLVIGENSKLWLLHDKPFPGVLRWIEYDMRDRTVTLVLDDGRTQNVGVKINPQIATYLRRASHAYAVLFIQGKVRDVYMVAVTVRD